MAMFWKLGVSKAVFDYLTFAVTVLMHSLESLSCFDQEVCLAFSVNSGDYIQAVCDRNLAENITRVLYPNDNVSSTQILFSLNYVYHDFIVGSVESITGSKVK